MSFADVEQTNSASFTKINHLRFSPGNHTVRILENEAHSVETHFVLGKFSITCLGEECPICLNNRKIILENPDNFRNVTGYLPRTKRFLFNVLDRTLVKTCPECGEENTKAGQNFAPTCVKCTAIITNVAQSPSNKIKLVTCGIELAKRLNGVQKGVLDKEGEPIGLTTYDIVFQVEGVGKGRLVNPLPAQLNNDVVEFDPEKLNDYTQAIIKLTAPEIVSFLKGVTLKDIYNGRSGKVESHQATAQSDAIESVANTVTPEVIAGVQESLNFLET
jgi:hypothetical protein